MGFEGFWSGQAGKTEVKYDGVYMREITESQLRYISGAGGAPATSAIVGALAGIPGGPLGVVVGAVSAGLTTAIGSTVGSGSASSSAGGGS